MIMIILFIVYCLDYASPGGNLPLFTQNLRYPSLIFITVNLINADDTVAADENQAFAAMFTRQM